MWGWDRRQAAEERTEETNSAPSGALPAATRTEGTPPDPKGEPLPLDTLEALLSHCRARVHEQILFAKDISEREIIAIGEIVQNIVDHSRRYIEESKHTVVDSFARQSISLSEYLTGTRQTTEVQGRAVKEVLALSDDITNAGLAVDKLANQSRLLALNAKIEAARLGSVGSAFSVITEEMNHLSVEIAKANRLIADSTKAIRASLPMLADQAQAQMSRLDEFSQTMQGIKDGIEASISATNSASESRVNQILNLAYEVLSHLQFQDPMIQSVQRIDALVRDLHLAMNQAMGITAAPDGQDAHFVETLGARSAGQAQDQDQNGAPDAGEVLLF